MSDPRTYGSKRLYRAREGRVVAGVCAGLGAYLGVDPTLVRLGFVFLSFFGGLGILFYLGAWIVLPEEGEKASIAENLVSKQRQRQEAGNRDDGPWTSA